jgi:hypothetical protein
MSMPSQSDRLQLKLPRHAPCFSFIQKKEIGVLFLRQDNRLGFAGIKLQFETLDCQPIDDRSSYYP